MSVAPLPNYHHHINPLALALAIGEEQPTTLVSGPRRRLARPQALVSVAGILAVGRFTTSTTTPSTTSTSTSSPAVNGNSNGNGSIGTGTGASPWPCAVSCVVALRETTTIRRDGDNGAVSSHSSPSSAALFFSSASPLSTLAFGSGGTDGKTMTMTMTMTTIKVVGGMSETAFLASSSSSSLALVPHASNTNSISTTSTAGSASSGNVKGQQQQQGSVVSSGLPCFAVVPLRCYDLLYHHHHHHHHNNTSRPVSSLVPSVSYAEALPLTQGQGLGLVHLSSASSCGRWARVMVQGQGLEEEVGSVGGSYGLVDLMDDGDDGCNQDDHSNHGDDSWVGGNDNNSSSSRDEGVVGGVIVRQAVLRAMVYETDSDSALGGTGTGQERRRMLAVLRRVQRLQTSASRGCPGSSPGVLSWALEVLLCVQAKDKGQQTHTNNTNNNNNVNANDEDEDAILASFSQAAGGGTWTSSPSMTTDVPGGDSNGGYSNGGSGDDDGLGLLLPPLVSKPSSSLPSASVSTSSSSINLLDDPPLLQPQQPHPHPHHHHHQYSVTLLPDRDYGMGLRLDVKNSAIIVDGFKRRPPTTSASASAALSPASAGANASSSSSSSVFRSQDIAFLGLLPAEACGVIRPGDELIGISQHSLQGIASLSTVIDTIRSIYHYALMSSLITRCCHLSPTICYTMHL